MAIRVPQCLFGVACLAVIQVWPIYSFAQPKTANANIFQQLIVGQHVSLMRGPNGYYEINLVSEGNVGPYVVREISHSFISLDDVSQVLRIWIPVTSISSVSWLHLKK